MPRPNLVKLKPPETMPLMTSVPDPPMLVAAVRTTSPATLPVVVDISAPPAPEPAPEIVNCSLIAACTSNVPALVESTVVPPSVVPKAVAFNAARIPLNTAVAPV